MESRQKYLDDLDQFLENCQMKVTQMLDGLGWTPDHFIQVQVVLAGKKISLWFCDQ